MDPLQRIYSLTALRFFLFSACLLALTFGQVLAQTTFGGNSQHTGIFNAPAQPLNVIKWQTDIDFNNTGGLAHYGSPVISANNTVFVPVRTAADGFRVDAFDGATGTPKYTVNSDYIMPSHGWIPPYNLCVVGTRLYFAGAGGTMFHIDNIDSNSPGAAVREVFFTSLANYNANAAAFNNTVFVNTPITADSAGNIFFGFRIQGSAPAPLSTTQSGLARLAANGTGSFVLAGTAAGDALIDRDSHSAGPALSNDETSVYFPVKASSNAFYGYLVELNSTTLATRHTVFLKDPRNNTGARITDDSTSTPMVAPDGDVYFGVLANNPPNGSRGFLLRFSADLSITKTPGAFGWDYTPGIVPSFMVPSYTGNSLYLLFCKYNDYAFQDGSGVNRVAILDPNATQIDPHSSAPGLVEMREVLTLIGPTPDNAGPSFPFAVQEFCINAPAINPATNSVFFDSEDGHIYRWNLTANVIDQAVTLSPGLGQPYVPTVIGPDGTLYTLNGGNFFAVGTKPGVTVTISSSSPDVRNAVAGNPITFRASVAGSLPIPTGTVTFTDTTYNGFTPVTTILASNVPIESASVTTSALAAGGSNFGNHFITATYNGDGNHQSSSVTMLQKVHANASVTTIESNGPPQPGQSVTFTATVSSVPSGSGIPTGMVTFYDGTTSIGQLSLNTNGQATLTTTLGMAIHEIFAVYASDTKFAASSAQIEQIVGPTLQFSNPAFSASENAGHVDVQVTLVGSSATPVTVDYVTNDFGAVPCSASNGFASAKCDYQTTSGRLTFNPGEVSKTISISLVDDSYAEGNETFNVVLSNASGASLNLPSTAIVVITDNDPVTGANPIDQTEFFVRQHYLDFLNREPDTDGFNFWTNQINSCGSDAQCIELKRINVSAAFFLSIEFQETGYLVYRIHKTAFGTQGQPVPITFGRFLVDTQQIQKDVRVGIGNWQAQLEANKQAYALAFVQQNVFLNSYPNNLSANQVVAIMDTNAGGVLSQAEFASLVAILGNTPSDVNKRAQVLRAVAEDEDLKTRDFNRAFVLMQYFGYLRRNPNDLPDGDFNGFNFWLGKLNQFNGNFINADMVKSFLVSGEYRHRFGP
jgi:hypothetical protein